MKYIVLLAVLFVACQSSPKEPRQFKTGRFQLQGGDKNYVIVRDEKIQTEINQSTGESYQYFITWPDENTYHLTFKGSSDATLVGLPPSTTRITGSGDGYYTFVCTTEGDNEPFKGKMLKIK